MIENVKKYISEAFFILLERKDLSKITITELIKKAGVCKASFYRNFDNYESIIKNYLEKFFKDLVIKFSDDEFTLKEYIKEMLLMFFASRKKFNILSKRNLLYYIYPYLYDKVKVFLLHFDSISEEDRTFLNGGFTAIIYDWVKDNFKRNIDELTSFLLSKKGFILNNK